LKIIVDTGLYPCILASMTKDQLPRMPAQCLADPKEWDIIRRYCFDTREPIGRVLVLGALDYIQRQKKVKS
jgi:hypothetical protein